MLLGYKSVRKPKENDLVHQTVSPHERVGSGDETTSNNRAASRERKGEIILEPCPFNRLEISTDTQVAMS